MLKSGENRGGVKCVGRPSETENDSSRFRETAPEKRSGLNPP